MPATRRRPSRSRRASPWMRPSARFFAPAPTSAPRTTMRCWTAAILKACTSFASLCAGCARPSWSSRLFSRPRTPPGWSGRPAVLSICLARRATGTCLSPRRSPRSGTPGRTTPLSRVSQLRPRRNGHAPTSRRRRCARQNTRHSCSALAGGLRSRVGGARRTAPYSTSRSRVSGGPCSTGGTSGCLSADAISRDSRTTVFTGSGSRSRSCATRASFSPLNSLTASRAPISTLCAGFRTTSADSTTLPSLSVV